MTIPEKDSPEDIMDQWRFAWRAAQPESTLPSIRYDNGAFTITFIFGEKQYSPEDIKNGTRNLRRYCGADV